MVFISFMILFFSLLSSKYTTKPILITTLIISAFTSYFMNVYHVVIDSGMLRNTIQTDMHESFDLLSFKMVLYVLFLGLIPSWFVYKMKLQPQTVKEASISKLKSILLSVLLIVILLFSFSKFYTSFFREHKLLRYYTNPTYWIYSIGNYIDKTLDSGSTIIKPLGLDALIIEREEPKLVIMVVGEATRADHFSLNGYAKETNPLLKKEKIINFPKMYACGTSTAYSVPCMFSVFDRSDYSYKKGISNENVLDVLKHTHRVDMLWRDNNSDSKGVALRVPYEDYKSSTTNTLCQEGECRDEGMLVGLDNYINERKNRNILIVLHQMGNHGPAYYKRYPKVFEKFTPVCETNQLEECTSESISNAYDNALLYSDYFLSKVIQLLKKHNNSHETSMIYMSDHGESLGENGLYLHGLPYFMAPDAQTHIASFMWFGDETKKIDNMKSYSQDNLFHTLLGLFGVQTEVYDKRMDILNEHR